MFLRFDPPCSKIKYRDTLQKASRWFRESIAILFTNHRDTFAAARLETTFLTVRLNLLHGVIRLSLLCDSWHRIGDS